MTDFFALLSFPRKPFLDAAEVKARFSELAAPIHPDRVHQSDDSTRKSATEQYTGLNSACQTLSDTRLRLKHLIELETGHSPSDIGNVPPHISELFFKVGKLFRHADGIIAEREGENSPMVRVQIMRRAFEAADDLKTLQKSLVDQLHHLDARCRRLDVHWVPGDFKSINEATILYRDYSYLNKWLIQAQEKQLQLTL